MEKVVISLVLGILPVMSWLGQYHFSKEDKMLKLFRKNWTCYYLDWIFVLVNIIFLYSVVLSAKIYWILLLSIVLNIFAHYIWGEENKRKSWASHFYYKNSYKIDSSGLVHFLYSIVQMTILFSLFFLEVVKPFIYFELGLVFIFGALLIHGSKKIHGKTENFDIFIGLTIMILVLVKYFLLIF